MRTTPANNGKSLLIKAPSKESLDAINLKHVLYVTEILIMPIYDVSKVLLMQRYLNYKPELEEQLYSLLEVVFIIKILTDCCRSL